MRWERKTQLCSYLQALRHLVSASWLSKVSPLHSSGTVPATLNVLFSHTHCLLLNACWKALPLSHFAWLSPSPFSFIFLASAAFQKLVQVGSVPSSVVPQVLTSPGHWVPTFLPVCYTETRSSFWVRRCSHHRWLTVQVCDQLCHDLVVWLWGSYSFTSVPQLIIEETEECNNFSFLVDKNQFI